MNRIVSVVVFIFVLFYSIGCGGYPDSNGPVPVYCDECAWVVIVDENFSLSQEQAILTALEDWKLVVPRIKFSVHIAQMEEKNPFQNKTIYIHHGYASDMDLNKGTGYSFWRSFGGDVYLNVYGKASLYNGPQGDKIVETVTVHELGHVLGLGHTDANGNLNDIMNASSNTSSYLTQEDVDKFNEIHHNCR